MGSGPALPPPEPVPDIVEMRSSAWVRWSRNVGKRWASTSIASASRRIDTRPRS